MVSKNNFKNKMEQTAARTPHYGIRKLSVGVASVLISTTLYMGATTAKADTLPSTATDTATTKPETASSSSSTQDNTTVDKTVETTVPKTASSTDTSVSTTPNAQASTTNTNNDTIQSNTVNSTRPYQNQQKQVEQWNQNPTSKPTEKWKYESPSGPYYQQQTKQQETNTNNDTIQSNTVNSTRPYQDQQKQVERWNQNPASKPTEKWKYESQSGPYYQQQTKQQETNADNHQIPSEIYSYSISAIDTHNNNRPVVSTTVSGTTGQQVPTNVKLPDGYTVEGSVPDSYTFKADGNSDITIHLKHNTVIVIPEKPKTTEDKLPNNPSKSYPKGVAENDLNKTVVRTIKVTIPDGKTTTTKQTVKLNRVAVVDEVTGQVTYSKWSIGELDRYDVTSIEGYTPSQDRVNMEVATSETKDSVVEISYTPNGQSINITYVDDDKGETTVDSYILAGKTDETVKTGIKIPDGYEVEGQVPTDYTFKAKDNTDITVRLKHKLDKGTETKTVSRIVEITLPDGQTKTIKQEQTLKRSKTTDLVTGDVVYGEWSKAEFDEVVAPEVDGYKPSQAKVEKETVDGNSSDQVVKITYKKVKSDVKVEAKPTVEAKHEAKVQVAPKVEAKASAKPQAKAQPKFVTTELPQTGEKQSKGTTIGAILVGLGSLLGLGALGKRKEK